MRKERTQADLVHDSDSGILALLVQLHHSGGDVASSDDILLLANGRLDDGGVESVRNERNDYVDLADLLIEGVAVIHI